MTGLGPFDLHGPEFLTLYCELALIALFAALIIPRYLRPDGQRGRCPDEAEIALLAGGRDRFAETVTVGLLAKGAATVQPSGKVAIRDPRGGETTAERRVAALTSPASWQDIHRALAGPAETAERQLEAKGLWMDRSAARQLRLIQTAPLALLFLFGLTKWIVGALRDRPVGILTALLIVTAIAAILRFAVIDRRTRAGKAALANARQEAERLRRAAPTDETPLAVARSARPCSPAHGSRTSTACAAPVAAVIPAAAAAAAAGEGAAVVVAAAAAAAKLHLLAMTRKRCKAASPSQERRHMRFKALLLAALAALPAPVLAQANDPATLDPEITSILTKWMAQNHIPGMVFGVVKDGRLAYVRSEGVQDLVQKRPVTPDTLFRIASMTKAFTALSILKLRDEGKLALDDPADRYVPELRGWTYPTTDSPRITIRDLLTHSAGFVTDDPWGDRQTPLSQTAFTAMLRAGIPFTRAPEMRHEYANLGYAILGRVIANITKASYRSFVEQRLLTPLGMTATGFNVLAHPKDKRAIGYRWENDAWAVEPTMKDGAFNAMGGLETSATDYAKWLSFITSAWPPRDGADTGIAKRATVRQIMRGANNARVFHRLGTGGDKQCPGALAYGMGWRVITDCDYGMVLAHGGGYPGYGSHVMVLPEYGAALFALTNKTYAGPSQPVWDIAALLTAKGVLVKRVEPVSPDLASFYTAAQTVWTSGTIDALQGRVAMNFPMDRTAANWAKVLAETKAKSGTCETSAPIAADGALSGTFTWKCEKGSIKGTVLLAPTKPITLQALGYAFEVKD